MRHVPPLYHFPSKHRFKLQGLEPGSGGFGAQLSPQTRVSLNLGIWPLFVNEKGLLQTLDLHSTLPKLVWECSDPSLFVLGRGVAVMLCSGTFHQQQHERQRAQALTFMKLFLNKIYSSKEYTVLFGFTHLIDTDIKHFALF